MPNDALHQLIASQMDFPDDSQREPQRSTEDEQVASRPPGSGRDSPLSVSDLPRSYGALRPAMNAVVRGGVHPKASSAQGIAKALHNSAASSVAEWPRGRVRHAVSRVGYISDDEDATAAAAPEAKGEKEGTQRVSGTNGEVSSNAVPQTPSVAPPPSPKAVRSTRDMQRHRVQQMHLAVPTAM